MNSVCSGSLHPDFYNANRDYEHVDQAYRDILIKDIRHTVF